MNKDTVRLNIVLPISITKALDQFSGPRKRSQFIAEAIEFRIKELKRKKLDALLIEGYKATKEEGIEITKEFEAIDFESWDEF